MATEVINIDSFVFTDEFFSGLAAGEFCLVLGAGFSAGALNQTVALTELPNTGGVDYTHIPLGTQFIELTNEVFNATVTNYRAAAALWQNRGFSISQGEGGKFFKALFTTLPGQPMLMEYAAILSPEWHAVFTLNFDDFFEKITATAGKQRQYKVYAYPDSGITLGEDTTPIAHLHGKLQGEGNVTIVFDYSAYVGLANSKHTLYDTLHTAVQGGKKLIIIGTQFDEHIIDDKFFDTLPEDITVYHFDLSFDNIIHKTCVCNNPNYHPITITGITEFITLLAENEPKIKNCKVTGTETINKHFIKHVHEGGGFTRQDYYLAKQHRTCQWYGIINRFDALRAIYGSLREAAKDAFAVHRQGKVAAVLLGGGGSGKSTLLRRLAVDLHDCPQFEVLWLLEELVSEFYESGLKKIQSDQKHNYLLVVEDWYRISARFPTECRNILQASESIPNLRIIIGDREGGTKPYKTHLYNNQNLIRLTADENKTIITSILDGLDHDPTAPQLSGEAFQAPLYLLLFIIFSGGEARHFSITTRDEVSNQARKIAESDFKAIARINPGLCTALYYWACLYANVMVFLPYRLLLHIAKKLHEFDTDAFDSLSADSAVLAITRKYVSQLPDTYRDTLLHPEEWIRFNHDSLATELIANVNLEGVDPFDNSKRYLFMQCVCESADSYVSSALLSIVFTRYAACLTEEQYWKLCADLMHKENKYFRYLNIVGLLPGTHERMLPFITFALRHQIAAGELFKAYIKRAPATAAEKVLAALLEPETVTAYNPIIFLFAFSYPSNSLALAQKRNQTVEVLLQKPDFHLLNEQVVHAILDYAKKYINMLKDRLLGALLPLLESGSILKKNPYVVYEALVFPLQSPEYETRKEQCIVQILRLPPVSVHTDLLHHALSLRSSNSDIQALQYDSVFRLLTNDQILAFQPALIALALNYQPAPPAIRSEQVRCANTILRHACHELKQQGTTSINDHVLLASVRRADNQEFIAQFQQSFLLHEPLSRYDPRAKEQNGGQLPKKGHDQILISSIIKHSKNTPAAQAAVDRLLHAPDFNKNPWQIQIQCLKCSSDIPLKQEIARTLYLPHWEGLHTGLLQESFRAFAGIKEVPPVLAQIADSIINTWRNPGGRRKHKQVLQFASLISIPMHNLPGWQTTVDYLLKSFHYVPRRIHVSLILSHLNLPQKTEALCRSILTNWRKEIEQVIHQEDTRQSYGDHIYLALGHPNCSTIADTIVPELYEYINGNNLRGQNLSKNLISAVRGVVEQSLPLPTWEAL